MADKAIAAAPHHSRAYVNRGSSWVALDELEKAKSDFERAAELSPALRQAHKCLAVLALKKDDRGAAFRHFKTAANLGDAEAAKACACLQAGLPVSAK